MSKPIIAVDVDDTLSLSAAGFADYSNKTWDSGITVDDYCEEWAIPWKVSHEVAVQRALQFHNAGVVGAFSVIKGAKEGIEELARKHDLVVVTSRRLVLKPETDAWLQMYFSGLFKDVIYAGIWEQDTAAAIKNNLATTKTDICLSIGASVLIDDQLKHCSSAAASGVEAVLFGDYSWNRSAEALPGNVVRKANWREVTEYIR